MPAAPSSKSRLALMAGLAVAGWKVNDLLADPTVLPPDDFVEYWAAGSLNASGQNPFDGDLLLPLERRAGRDTDEAIMMWNPPWTLTVAMPIGVLKPRVAQFLWLAVSLVLVLASVDLLWTIYGGPAGRRWISWLVALTFVPTLFVLQAGQIGPFVLMGITGFLVAERAGRPRLAGASGALIAIKPHLVYLFWVALAVWAVRRPLPNRWKVIAGGVIAGAVATAIPILCNPDVLGQYWDALRHRPPEQFRSPTIGTLLREIAGADRFDLQFVPTLLGLGWLAVIASRDRGRPWDWPDRMPMLVFVSFITASYGAWPFDLVILLPAVIHVVASMNVWDRRATGAALTYATINGVALTMNLLHCKSDMFFWMAPSLLVAYVLFRPGAR